MSDRIEDLAQGYSEVVASTPFLRTMDTIDDNYQITRQICHPTKNMELSYAKMNIMRKEKTLCDLTVKIGTRSIPAHKVVLASSSDYFEKLLTGGFKETNSNEINIEGIDPTAFELIVDYMYTSQLKITSHNVQDLLYASKFLLFDKLYDECVKYMKDTVGFENCLEYTYWAKSFNESEIEEICWSFSVDNFLKVHKSSEFQLLSCDQISKFFQDSNLNVQEKNKFEAIISWVEHDVNDRSRYLPKLLEFIDTLHISLYYFITNIEQNNILKTYYKDYINDSMEMYADHYEQRESDNKLILAITCISHCESILEWIPVKNQSRPSYSKPFVWKNDGPSTILEDGKIVSMELSPSKEHWIIRVFDGITKQWTCHEAFKSNGFGLRGIIAVKDCVFTMTFNGVFRKYNVTENKWTELKQIEESSAGVNVLTAMRGGIYYVSDIGIHQYFAKVNEWRTISHEKRPVGSSFAVCCTNNFIYVLGTPKNDYRSSYRFNTFTKSWGRISNMNQPREHASAVTVDGMIYIVGGLSKNSCEVYNSTTDKWFYMKNNVLTENDCCGTLFVTAVTEDTQITPEQVPYYYSY